MEFRILGPLEIRTESGLLPLPGVKPRAVLAVLLLHANEPVSADELAIALWGEDARAGAGKTVQVHVSRLRKALGGADILQTTPAGYRLHVNPDELDLERFQRLTHEGRAALLRGRAQQAGQTLREALDLWRGRPLADVAAEPFAAAEIARLEEQRMATVEARVDADLAAGAHALIVSELRGLAATQPLRERLAGQLMLALYRCGRQAEALEEFRRARARLVAELGVEPGPELRRLHDAILRHDDGLESPRSSGDTAHPSRRAVTRRRLPAAPTPTIGREADVTAMVRTLGERRLVTLIGAAGVGKTRLAVETARELMDEFESGACVAWLANVADASGVASELARAVRAEPAGDEPLSDALVRHLGDEDLLIVVDNMEHVLDAAPLLEHLLSRCPRVRVLATSREPLRLNGEWCVQVSPLPRPAAIELFVQRALARRADFAAQGPEWAAVAEICERLDGLPLAIELAAGRVGLLSPVQLAARLGEALDVLSDGARDAPVHQRAVRATLDWSVRRLSEAERAAFEALSAFVGGASLEAAEAITMASVTVLDALVSRNLVHAREQRLWMLEVVRQYAAERLADSSVQTAVHARHAEWFLGLAERHAPEVRMSGRGRSLHGLAIEHGNFEIAMSRAIAAGDAELAQRLVGALGDYWWVTGRYDEGVRWSDAVLDLDAPTSPAARGRALLTRASFSLIEAARTGADVATALDLLREADDKRGVSQALGLLSRAAASDGDYDRAGTLARQARSVAADFGDPFTLAMAIHWQARVAERFADARAFADDAARRFRALAHTREVAQLRSAMGFLAIREGEYAAAEEQLLEASGAAHESGDAAVALSVAGNRGLAALLTGRTAEAALHFREELQLAESLHLRTTRWEALLGLAAVAAEHGEDRRAALLYGASLAAGAHPAGAEDALVFANIAEARGTYRRVEQVCVAAQERLGTKTWAGHVADGRALSPEDALTLAAAE